MLEVLKVFDNLNKINIIANVKYILNKFFLK